MPKKKNVVRRAWTKADMRLLQSMAKEKRGATKIAKALNRTVAIRAMAVKRRVSLSTRA